MISLTHKELQETYGIDIQVLREACPATLIGIVSPDGAIWRGDPTRCSLPHDDRLVDMVSSCGAREGLVLLSDGEPRELLEHHCAGCPAGVKCTWIPTPRGAFCLLVKNTSQDPLAELR